MVHRLLPTGSELVSEAFDLGELYQFLFMHASGAQLKKITTLIDDNLIRPVVGETLPFTQIPAALKSLDNSTVRGKTVFSSNL